MKRKGVGHYIKYLEACEAVYGFLGSKAHVDPGTAYNLALAIAGVTEDPKGVLAWWLFVHPDRAQDLVDLLADKDKLGKGWRAG